MPSLNLEALGTTGIVVAILLGYVFQLRKDRSEARADLREEREYSKELASVLREVTDKHHNHAEKTLAALLKLETTVSTWLRSL